MPQSETEKRANLAKALAAVSTSATHCNDHIAKAALHAQARELQKRFQGKVPVDLNRRLVLEETM